MSERPDDVATRTFVRLQTAELALAAAAQHVAQGMWTLSDQAWIGLLQVEIETARKSVSQALAQCKRVARIP
jgi:hypothetical protein